MMRPLALAALLAKGPKGERRPDDPASAAVTTVQIALGEIEEKLDAAATKKDAAAFSAG